MRGKWLVGAFALALALGFAADSALAWSCPRLIGAARRLAAKYKGPDKGKILALINEALADHNTAVKEKKGRLHTRAMQKATRAVDMLVPKGM